jgi:hypothetical protein
MPPMFQSYFNLSTSSIFGYDVKYKRLGDLALAELLASTLTVMSYSDALIASLNSFELGSSQTDFPRCC